MKHKIVIHVDLHYPVSSRSSDNLTADILHEAVIVLLLRARCLTPWFRVYLPTVTYTL